MLKILPKGILGTGGDAGQSYILEKSVVDAKDGWMETETKNLEWTGILSISEKQVYKRLSAGLSSPETSTNDLGENTKYEGTDVTTTVTLLSRFGQAKALRRKGEVSGAGSIPSSDSEDEIPAKKGFFASWSTSSLQRTIEMIGLKRTREALAKSKDGMNVVLGRYRSGGLAQILEGMNEDKHRAFGENGPWKRVWHQGQDSSNED